ncbi:izumo sperm-egg fusion protein 1 [Aplochiton taeniatus]
MATSGRCRANVSALCCIPAARSCLQCDARVRHFHEDFILSAPSLATQIELNNIKDHAYVTYRETSQDHSGVIDPTTLYRASTEYQSEFDRFLSTKRQYSLTFETIQIMEKSRKILEKHVEIFALTGKDCAEHSVQAEEGGQEVLDCFLPWHKLIMGRPEYHYSWSPGMPGTKNVTISLRGDNFLTEVDFQVLVVTEDSSVVLNQIRLDEQGTYRCLLCDRNGTVFSKITFLLFVKPMPVQTKWPHLTLPTMSPPAYHYGVPSKNLLLALMSTITALSLAGSIGLAIFFG